MLATAYTFFVFPKLKPYFCKKPMLMKNFIKDLVERHAFGACSYLGEKIGISTARVRVYFIYISFLTIGSPVIVYLFVAFWVNIRRYIRKGKNMIWS